MRYFGSKASSITDVFRLISARVSCGSICDPFGGIGIVGSFFKMNGYSVWSGDTLTFAHYFQIAKIEQDELPSFSRLRNALGLSRHFSLSVYLNNLGPKDGWFVEEYSSNRNFFTYHNATHIEACRQQLLIWSHGGLVNRNERAVLLASLINSMDKVANTAGTYYAYLKSWDRKALLPFSFHLIQPTKGSFLCRSFLSDANELIKRQSFDILYLDPPYNSRCYSSYYHLPETLALELTPHVHGKSGQPNIPKKLSPFNLAAKAGAALHDILKHASFRLLAFHYADNGLISPDIIENTLSQYGQLEKFIINSKGYTTTSSKRMTKHILYLVAKKHA